MSFTVQCPGVYCIADIRAGGKLGLRKCSESLPCCLCSFKAAIYSQCVCQLSE